MMVAHKVHLAIVESLLLTKKYLQTTAFLLFDTEIHVLSFPDIANVAHLREEGKRD
jgi:hypothetical protein